MGRNVSDDLWKSFMPEADDNKRDKTASAYGSPKGGNGLMTSDGLKGGNDYSGMSYTEMYDKLTANKPETEEQRVKRRSKEKRQKVLSALSDGISSISNLFFATQGAAPVYDATKGMSAQMAARLQRAKDERAKRQNAYAEGIMRARAMDEQRQKDERSWRRQLEIDQQNREVLKAKEQRDSEMHKLQIDLAQKNINMQDYKAQEAEIKAKYAEALQKAGLDKALAEAQTERSRSYSYQTQAQRNKSQAAYYDRGGNKAKWHLNGQSYGTKEEYEAAIKALALKNGIPIERDYTEETNTSEYGEENKKVQKIVKKQVPINELAGELIKRGIISLDNSASSAINLGVGEDEDEDEGFGG